ncbi:MAG: hypothetical protein ACRC5M_02790, partial [Anaeroplasmataceae bacterium]
IAHADGSTIDVALSCLNNENAVLDTNGKIDMVMVGNMTVPSNASRGSYKGSFVASIRYE